MLQRVKCYPIHQSPFYKISSKKKLSKQLGVSIKTLLKVTSDDNYRIFKKNGREIQEPIGILKTIHKKIKEYLSRLEYPDYLFSGIKKRSAIGNAKYHINSDYMVAIDIKSFYRSCSIKYVFGFFHKKLKMSPDTAYIISNILCFNNFIPTGSPSSQLVAYWSYSVLFNKIYSYAKSKEIIFSLYVDDMTFSSKNKINKSFHLEINSFLKKVNLKIKKQKTRYYYKYNFKKVTGCIINHNHSLCVRNQQKKKIILKLNELYSNKYRQYDSYIINSLLGLINQCQQIEPNIFKYTKTQIFLLKN